MSNITTVPSDRLKAMQDEIAAIKQKLEEVTQNNEKLNRYLETNDQIIEKCGADILKLKQQRDELLAAAQKYIGALDSWDGSAKADRYTKRCEGGLRFAIASAEGSK